LDTIPYGAATDTDTNGEARLDYLRGDHSDEQQNSGSFRNRTSILGDIVDSSPAYVGPPGFSYPDTWADGGPESGYSTFRTSHADRTPVVYAGANDGMLHGIDASVDHSVNPPVGGITSTSGTEVLAYVPNAVFANLSKLTSPNYVHQYYVDGPPTAGDVYFGDAWHTVLVGGLRGGGAGIYALDITKPANFSEDNAAKIVLWEFSNVDTSNGTTGPGHDQNLGYTFSQPAIVRLANKKWAAVFGNGYHNKDLLGNGMAYLYVVDIQTGKLIKTFGPLGDSTSNGLSTPAPVDVDGDNVVDYIYAGDLQGNLWKFQFKDPDDPSSDPSNPSNWNVAFSGSPLYTATDDTTAHNRQPITTRPEVGASPTGQGLLIYFGTGKYFESGDSNVTGATAQTFYAIWDKNDGTHGFDRSKLQEQTVLTSTTTDGYNLRVTSDNSIAWNTGSNDTTGKLGWYIDLPTTGERQVSDSVLRGGQIIFTTLIPSQAPCDFGGSSWLMELDASSGSRPATSPFDISGDGRFDSEDLVEVTLPGHDEKQQVPSSGIAPTDPGIFWTPLIVSETTGIRQHKYMSESTSAVWHITENPGSAGRQTWRQIR
jgi:type IV pilus assembly protein PilY1